LQVFALACAQVGLKRTLRSLGFDVKDIAYEDVNSVEVLAAMPSADFLLVSKVPSLEWLQALKQVRAKTQAGDKPIYMWFWDPIDYSEDRRHWFVDVGRECDAVFINEKVQPTCVRACRVCQPA